MEFLLLVLVLLGCGGRHAESGLFDYQGQPLVWEPLLQQPFDLLYTGGVREYHRGQWERAVCLLERALLAHSALRRLRARCQRLCGPGTLPPPPRGGAFSTFLQTAACLQHCLSVCLGQPSRHRVTQQIQTDFQRRTVYNYLQLAYYRVKEVDKAAAAAQTFFEMNPDHQEMRENLEMYRKMEGVKPEDFRDLEAQPHWVSYSDGLNLYRSEQFVESIPPLELAIQEYMTELEECQAQCEGPYQSPDYTYLQYQSHLYEAISDHYIQVLGCKQDCVRELATKPGSAKAIEDFLPSHFYLLQSAYHKVGNYEKAVECSRTFLLFRPEDNSVQQNLDFYRSKLPAGEADKILPREDIKVHINESLFQKEMLLIAMESLGVPFDDPDSWTPAELVPQSIRDRPRWENSKDQLPSAETETVQEEAPEVKTEEEDGLAILRASPPFTNLKVLMDWNQLGGSQRVVFDGLLSPEECMTLRNLGNAAAAVGAVSGSDSPPDPLSGHRETLTILRALRLARDGVLRRENAGLYPDVSERVKVLTQTQFSPSSPLHLTWSQLECQDARGGSVDTRRLTVPGVECLWDPESAACWTESARNPARELSAFLYLNDEFEGGEFYFTDSDGEITSGKILPKCGRLVIFTSSSENSHNVHRVTGGQRCVIALWFSHDSKHNEEERLGAAMLLDQLFPPLPVTTGTSWSSPPDSVPQAESPQGQPDSQPKAKKPKKKKKGKKSSQATESRTPAKDEL